MFDVSHRRILQGPRAAAETRGHGRPGPRPRRGLPAIHILSGGLALALSVSVAAPAAGLSPPVPPSPVPNVSRLRCDPDLSALRQRGERPGPTGARAAYLLAHCLAAGGRSGEAWAVFEGVAGRYPPLASYARFYAALMALRLGAAPDAAARLAAVLASGPSTPLARRVRMAYAEALIQAGSTSRAVEVLRAIVEAAPDETSSGDEMLAHAWWLLGVAAEALADRGQARRAYTMAWWAFPDSADAARAAGRLRDLTAGRLPVPPPDVRVKRARRLLKLGERAAAERELATALHAGLSPDVAAEAWYHLGLLRLRSGAAAYAFRQAARHPDHAAPALLWLGTALARTGRRAEARAVWRTVEQQHPAGVWAARALLALASFAGDEEWRAADGILTAVVRRFPGSSFAAEASWRRGWLRFRLRRVAEAEAIWRRAAETLPGSPRAPVMLYWAAKAREQRGANARSLLEQVARRYPMTYYGQRARSRLGWPAPTRILPPGDGLPTDRFAATHEELGAMGFDREAADEAEALLQSNPDPGLLRFIAGHRSRAGEIPASVAAAAEALSPVLYGGSTADVELWMLAYPRAYWDQVRAAAAAARVDPHLVLAVMREESRFDAQAVSPAGAVGLMQLLPETASALGGRRMSARDLTDPELSLRYGAAYLGGALRRFRGDVVPALVAYNAGPAAARRFDRQRGDRDLVIERIPFAETRAYVQRVLESYGIYRWLYAP